MATYDKRVDAYIDKAADFAKPILEHIRDVVHRTCPEIEETMKWSFPHFDYNGILCSMAAFKHHCAFGFWKASIMQDDNKLLTVGNKSSMGHFGQLKSLNDLPPEKIFVKYIKEAVRLNKDDIRIIKKPASNIKKTLTIPRELKKALLKNSAANITFEGFSYSNKKDYVEWISEAKTEVTRQKRLAIAIEWLAEGKTRHWKYN